MLISVQIRIPYGSGVRPDVETLKAFSWLWAENTRCRNSEGILLTLGGEQGASRCFRHPQEERHTWGGRAFHGPHMEHHPPLLPPTKSFSFCRIQLVWPVDPRLLSSSLHHPTRLHQIVTVFWIFMRGKNQNVSGWYVAHIGHFLQMGLKYLAMGELHSLASYLGHIEFFVGIFAGVDSKQCPFPPMTHGPWIVTTKSRVCCFLPEVVQINIRTHAACNGQIFCRFNHDSLYVKPIFMST